jgi:hypothetical protein
MKITEENIRIRKDETRQDRVVREMKRTEENIRKDETREETKNEWT